MADSGREGEGVFPAEQPVIGSFAIQTGSCMPERECSSPVSVDAAQGSQIMEKATDLENVLSQVHAGPQKVDISESNVNASHVNPGLPSKGFVNDGVSFKSVNGDCCSGTFSINNGANDVFSTPVGPTPFQAERLRNDKVSHAAKTLGGNPSRPSFVNIPNASNASITTADAIFHVSDADYLIWEQQMNEKYFQKFGCHLTFSGKSS